MSAPFIARQVGDAIVIRVKAVPGAKSDVIVGALGDRLKVRVAAPPEGGRANEAIARLIAESLGIPLRAVSIVVGHASAEKQFRIVGATMAMVAKL